MVKDYKGDPAIAAGEAFDATPANLDARAQRFTLANGMKVVLLPKKTRGETVNISLRLHYGDVSFGRRASRDRRRSPAACSCAARPSTVARRSKTPSTSSRRRSRSKAAQTGASASGQTVRANLAPTLDLLAEVLQSPAFPPAELETLKRAAIAGVEQSRTDPRSVVVRAQQRYENPYPKGDDRYAPTVDEEIAELQAPDVDALKRFYREFYGASAAELAIVGDFDAPAVKAQLERLFGSWNSPAPFTRVPQPLIVKKPTAQTIEMADKANAFFYEQTGFALTDKDPDYPALLVANHIFGGSANSRLGHRIRQKDGISYGIN